MYRPKLNFLTGSEHLPLNCMRIKNGPVINQRSKLEAYYNNYIGPRYLKALLTLCRLKFIGYNSLKFTKFALNIASKIYGPIINV